MQNINPLHISKENYVCDEVSNVMRAAIREDDGVLGVVNGDEACAVGPSLTVVESQGQVQAFRMSRGAYCRNS